MIPILRDYFNTSITDHYHVKKIDLVS